MHTKHYQLIYIKPMNETEPQYFREFRNHIDNRFSVIEKIFDEKIDSLAIIMANQFSDMKKYVDERFEGIDQKFEGIDQKFEGIEYKLDEIERNMVTKDDIKPILAI